MKSRNSVKCIYCEGAVDPLASFEPAANPTRQGFWINGPFSMLQKHEGDPPEQFLLV